MTAQITLDPDPPVQGSKCKVCITNGQLPGSGQVRFKVNGVWSDWLVIDWTNDNGGCVDVDVPPNASFMQAEDNDGDADYRSVACVPAT